MDDRLEAASALWTGVIEVMQNDTVRTTAHGQFAKIEGMKFQEGQLVTVYDVRRSQVCSDLSWTLTFEDVSKSVIIPEERNGDFLGVKDICAGMGGITMGLESAGYHRLASMDCKELMCETLMRNGHQTVILGDVLNPSSRAALHSSPVP